MRKHYTQSSPTFQQLWVLWVALAAIVITVAALELTNVTHLFHKQVTLTAGPGTKGVPLNNAADTDQDKSSTETVKESSGNTQADTNSSNTSATLVAPTGPFVSNHRPNLSGSPAPNTINSVCNTTSGATCQIIFTKGNEVKSLPAQMTDKGGATYWNGWSLQSIGLTPGEWQITAKATLGSQTKTANDALNLEVSE